METKNNDTFAFHFSGHYPEDENLVRMISLSILRHKTIIGQDQDRSLSLQEISPALIELVTNTLRRSVGL